jgi:hypothetical protein
MAVLQIDRSGLANDDPLLLRDLLGLCALCRSKERCMRDLEHAFDHAAWGKWRDYCRNARTLMTLGAVQNCGLAAQHLRTPRSTSLSAVRPAAKDRPVSREQG